MDSSVEVSTTSTAWGGQMFEQSQIEAVTGATAYDRNGDKIGKVGQLFLDDQTGRPEFVTVNTGLFGTSESFVPVERATLDGDRLAVPFTKDKVKDAPKVDVENGHHLDEAEEQRLYEYYGMGDSWSGVGRPQAAPRGPEGQDLSGPETDEAMTRSEEHLRVGKASQEAGRARLRKYIVTEQETHTVPVRKERAVLETEPITQENAGQALDGPAISEEEHEVVLHEERVVVEKTAEPVERVRLSTESMTEEETVTGEVRKERIEAEGDVDRRLS
jgi:uncharacterized protein (TIGR02271 family)